MVTWKLRDYLNQHKVSAYALSKSTDLAPSTVYSLARGAQSRVDLEVLDKVIGGLEQLTGRRVTVSDLLEREPAPLNVQPKKSWIELAGSFDDPDSPGDIAANHDKYLGEALLDEHQEGLTGKR